MQAKTKQSKVKSDSSHMSSADGRLKETCCLEDGQASSDVVTDSGLPNMETPNEMNELSHMELTSVRTQLSDTRRLLAIKEVSQ